MSEGAAATDGTVRLARIGAIGKVSFASGYASAADWRAWTAAYDQWIADPNVYGALVRSGGGHAVRKLGGDIDLPALADLYRLIWTVDRFSKPTVALLDGTMSWADFCFVRHGTHKVVGESFKLDLTPPASGVLDAGATWWLARLAPHAAEPGAPLGATIDAEQSLALGLTTHHVTSSAFEAIERAYADADPIDQVLDGLPQLSSGESPVGDFSSRGRSQDAGELAVSLIREARTLSLKQTLERDYAIAMTLADTGTPGAWERNLARSVEALALKPPAGVPEALG